MGRGLEHLYKRAFLAHGKDLSSAYGTKKRVGVLETPSFPSGSEMPLLDASAIPADHPCDGDDDAGTYQGDQDADDVEAVYVQAQEPTGKEAPNHCADDAEDNVADEAVAAALHELAGKESRDKPEDDPGKNTHDAPLVGRRWTVRALQRNRHAANARKEPRP
jgi:hypothetical protein